MKFNEAELPPSAPIEAYDDIDYDRDSVDEVGAAVAARPTVTITAELADVVDQAERVLQDTGIYQRAGQLVRVIALPERVALIERATGTAWISPHDSISILDSLSRSATWVTWDARRNRLSATRPPRWIAETMLSRGTWTYPALRGIVTAPTIKASGEVLDKPGYDQETGIMLLHSGRWPRIPDHPTRDHAEEALKALAEVIHDFPFVDGAARSGCISAILALVCRTFFDGPAPLYVVSARDAGTGKTRLADVISIIGTGHAAPVVTPWSTPEEADKTLMSIAIAGDPLVMIDNWPTGIGLGDSALDATLTTGRKRGRILGRSEMISCLWDAIVVVTGNNVTYAGDTARRVIPMDLDAQVECPEERTGFLHDPLLPWVRQERKRLVVACITILRAWHLAGRPMVGLPIMGSFEAWGSTIRQAIVWLGVDDPAGGRAELKATSDPIREALVMLLTRWRRVWGGEWKKAHEVTESLRESRGPDYDELREAFDGLLPIRRTDHPTTKAVGKLMAKHRGTVRGGLRLVQSTETDRDGVYWWRVEERP